MYIDMLSFIHSASLQPVVVSTRGGLKCWGSASMHPCVVRRIGVFDTLGLTWGLRSSLHPREVLNAGVGWETSALCSKSLSIRRHCRRTCPIIVTPLALSLSLNLPFHPLISLPLAMRSRNSRERVFNCWHGDGGTVWPDTCGVRVMGWWEFVWLMCR
jgi:hypothetical protein